MGCVFRVLRSRERAEKLPVVVAVSEKVKAERLERRAQRLAQEFVRGKRGGGADEFY